MTICVAAICADSSIILGASDRMLTAGDIQFQPKAEKIWIITNSIVFMVAGDVAIQSEIYQDVYRDVGERIKSDPEHWREVKEIADLYTKYYFALRSKRAEKAILAPLGLTNDTFISRQRELSPELVNKIATELLNFSMPDASVIVAGRDETGLHLYVINDGEITCRDRVGFAAIGIGYWHSNSQFMFAGHTARASFSEALTTVFAAKKRAEVAPGVGTATDMFMIMERLGSFTPIVEDRVADLEQLYQQHVDQSNALFKQHTGAVNDYIQRLPSPSTPPVQTIADTSDGKAPADIEETGGDPNESKPEGKSKEDGKVIEGATS